MNECGFTKQICKNFLNIQRIINQVSNSNSEISENSPSLYKLKKKKRYIIILPSNYKTQLEQLLLKYNNKDKNLKSTKSIENNINAILRKIYEEYFKKQFFKEIDKYLSTIKSCQWTIQAMFWLIAFLQFIGFT